MAMKKPGSGSSPTPLDGAALSDWTTLFPELWGHLSDPVWEGGEERRTSTLLLFWEEGLWKACLNDRALQRTAWSSGATPEGVLTSLEAGLADGMLEWRRPSGGKGKK